MQLANQSCEDSCPATKPPATDSRPARRPAPAASTALIAACAAGAAFAASPGLLFTQQATLNNFLVQQEDLYGSSVAVDGGVAVVGSPLDDAASTNQGSALIWRRVVGPNFDFWQNTQVVAPDGTMNDQFGSSVAVSGDIVVLGAPRDYPGGVALAGSAYVFVWNSGTGHWDFAAKLVAPDGAIMDFFGTSVAVSGDAVVVGAPGDDAPAAESGSAYVFLRDQGGADNWGFAVKLAAPDGLMGDNFGKAVAIRGDDVLIGAPFDDESGGADTGSAYLFGRNQGGADNFGFIVKLQSPIDGDGTTSDYVGTAVAVAADAAVIGAPGSNANRAYVYMRNQGGPGAWGFTSTLSHPDGGGGFGQSVGVSGDAAIVGSPGAGTLRGAGFIFARDAGGANNWGFVSLEYPDFQNLTARAGHAVAAGGDVAVIGAPYYDFGALNDGGQAFVYTGLAFAAAAAADCDTDGVYDYMNLNRCDCNGNGRSDACDIADGTSLDADSDGVPDECAVACQGDADGNGATNFADITAVLSNFNGTCP